MKREYKLFIQDILNAIRDIEGVVKNRLPERRPKVERMLAELDIPDAQSINPLAQIGTSGGDEGEGDKEKSNEK